MPDQEDATPTHKRVFAADYYRECVRSGNRPDGRSFLDCRKLTIDLNLVESGLSSALITLGLSSAFCVTYLETLPPCGDYYDEGRFDVKVELLSNEARTTSRGQMARRLEAQINEVLIAADYVNLKQLLIDEGETAYYLKMVISIYSDDGSLFDLCLIGACACLAATSKLPKSRAHDKSEGINASKEQLITALYGLTNDVASLPTPLTIGITQSTFVCDPTEFEVGLMESLFHLVVDKEGRVSGFYKTKGGPVEPAIMGALIGVCKERRPLVTATIDKALIDYIERRILCG